MKLIRRKTWALIGLSLLAMAFLGTKSLSATHTLHNDASVSSWKGASPFTVSISFRDCFRRCPLSTPPFGGYLVLDEEAYAVTPDHPELDVGDQQGESLTIEAWIRPHFPEPRVNGDWTIAGRGDNYRMSTSDSPGRGWWNSRGASGWALNELQGSIAAWVYHDGGQGGLFEPGFHHLAFVVDTESWQAMMFLDGERGRAFEIERLFLLNTDWTFQVGMGPYSYCTQQDGSMAGMIDELRVSDVARYKGETYSLPTAPFACDEHTRLLYHFDEVEGATIFHDACGEDNFLTGHNGAHTEGVEGFWLFLPLVLKGGFGV